MAIMAAHRVPYAATLSLAHRDDFLRKMRLALGMTGFRFLLMLSPCPAGWKSDPAESVELVRLAVACGLFPVYEVFDGERYRVNARPDGTPLDDYLGRQGRFRAVAPSPGRSARPGGARLGAARWAGAGVPALGGGEADRLKETPWSPCSRSSRTTADPVWRSRASPSPAPAPEKW